MAVVQSNVARIRPYEELNPRDAVPTELRNHATMDPLWRNDERATMNVH
jgi:hypothetical protein